jgi:dihydroneopterin aldolase
VADAPLVVKVGGALSHVAGALDEVAEALATLATRRAVIVIPGGGPFADQVRRTQREVGATEAAAHWMAILGMDQYALLLADRIPGARLAETLEALDSAGRGAVTIFAPYRWMRAADPLPHTWDATSDSVAAVVAGAIGARELLLVKAVSGTPETLADAWFPTARPAGLDVRCVTTRALSALAHAPPVPPGPEAGGG